MSATRMYRTLPVLLVAVGLVMACVSAGAFLVVGVLLCVVGLAWGIERETSRRRHANIYEQFARTHQWEFVPRTSEYNLRMRGYPFGEGSHAWQQNVVRGTYNGSYCATFAHCCETASVAGVADTQAYQITLAELPVALPRIELVPESIPTFVLKALGGEELDIESWEFNQRWNVRCEDPRLTSAVLDPRLVQFLIDTDADDSVIRIEGGQVYMWHVGEQDTQSLARRMSIVTGVARRIPPHVVRQRREHGYSTGYDRPVPRKERLPAQWNIDDSQPYLDDWPEPQQRG